MTQLTPHTKNTKTSSKKVMSVAAMVVSALLLVGCGPKQSETAAPTTEKTAQTAAPAAQESGSNSSPIGAFLGFENFSTDNSGEEAERQRRANRAVAKCMTEQGFQYKAPAVVNPNAGGFGSNEPGYWTKEWVAKYGMGISTMRFSQSAVGPNLVGYADELDEMTNKAQDPNEQYLKTLSPGERDAYDAALYGAVNDSGDAKVSQEGPGGCFGEGFKASYGDMVGDGAQFFEKFGDSFEQLDARIKADSRVVEWRKKISTCMADRGRTFTDYEKTREQIEARLSSIAPAGSNADVDLSSMSERQIEEFYQTQMRIPADKLPELAAIQKDEIATAKDLVACGGGEVNESNFMAEIRRGYEEKFLKDNAEELAQFKGAFSEG